MHCSPILFYRPKECYFERISVVGILFSSVTNLGAFSCFLYALFFSFKFVRHHMTLLPSF
jgi:hypothetical protein